MPGLLRLSEICRHVHVPCACVFALCVRQFARVRHTCTRAHVHAAGVQRPHLCARRAPCAFHSRGTPKSKQRDVCAVTSSCLCPRTAYSARLVCRCQPRWTGDAQTSCCPAWSVACTSRCVRALCVHARAYASVCACKGCPARAPSQTAWAWKHALSNSFLCLLL